MNKPPLPQGRKRSGCLKFACGGCLGAIVVMALFAFLLWRYFTWWTPGASAWENLPPSTVAALEIHDVKKLMRIGWADPGLRGLAEQAVSGPELAHLAAASKNGYVPGNLYAEAMEAFEAWGTMYKYIGPDIALFGLGGERGDSLFGLIAPTNLMRLLLRDYDGKIGRRDLHDGDVAYYTLCDGWLVLAGDEAMLREIVDNWAAKPAPFGAALGEKNAFLHFAKRPPIDAAEPPPAESRDEEAQSLLFADPFAAARETPGRDVLAACRLALRPVDGGWSVRGWLAPDSGVFLDAGANGALRGASTRVAAPVRRGAAKPEVNLAVGTGSRTIPDWFDRLSPLRTDDSPGAAKSPWRRFLADWRQSLSNDLVVQLFKPAAPRRDGVPPLPVAVAGWTLPTGMAAGDAAARFNSSVSALVNGAFPPGTPPAVANALRANAALRVDDRGGDVSLPPVAVNSAHPAWVFLDDGGVECGWFASDPAGLPDDNALFSPSGGFFAPGRRDGLVLDWDASAEFVMACREVAEDRLSSLPADSYPWAAGALAKFELLRKLLIHYPRGSASLEKAEGGAWVDVDVAVPYGVRGR